MIRIFTRRLLLLAFVLGGCTSADGESQLPMKNTPEHVAMNYVLGANYLDMEKIRFAVGETAFNSGLDAKLRGVTAALNENNFPAVVRRVGVDVAKIKAEFVEKFEDAFALVLIHYWPVSTGVLYKKEFRTALMQTSDRDAAVQTAKNLIRNKHGSVDQVRKPLFLIIPMVKTAGRWYPMLKEIEGSYGATLEAELEDKIDDPEWAARLELFSREKSLDLSIYARGSFVGPKPPTCNTMFCQGALDLQSQALADVGKY